MEKVLDTQTSKSYKFEDLPTEGPNLLLDTEAINKKYAARRDNPFRIHEGVFRVPSDASDRVVSETVKRGAERFIRWMEKRGWTLKSKLKVIGPEPSRDATRGFVVLGENQYRVRAIFAVVPEPMRIELPLHTIKQAPDHIIPETYKNAIAMNKAHPIKGSNTWRNQ